MKPETRLLPSSGSASSTVTHQTAPPGDRGGASGDVDDDISDVSDDNEYICPKTENFKEIRLRPRCVRLDKIRQLYTSDEVTFNLFIMKMSKS